jgi:hypothetical protein
LLQKALSRSAIHKLMPFASTYLSDTGFSNYATTKTKYRNRPNVAPDLIIQLSGIMWSIKRICKTLLLALKIESTWYIVFKLFYVH